jgi:RNA polymerase sigma-70 factor (ECF subfamily)
MLSPLPLEQREAVAAHVLDDAPYEELARDAGVTTSAIRHRVSRGLHALRDQLAGDRR